LGLKPWSVDEDGSYWSKHDLKVTSSMTPTVTDTALISRATAVLNPRRLSPTVEVGDVGCALVTATGAAHVGVCIDATCGLGFCAEHAAVASMITRGESRIRAIVAVGREGAALSPCGRCRELIYQIDPGNVDTRILLKWQGNDFAPVASRALAT
jgi:cytidine deaminase